jgi:predicted GTPase
MGTRQSRRIVDPRPWAAPDIEAADADIVAGTPIGPAALIRINKPVLRARYDFAELELPGLWGAVEHRLENLLQGKP